MKYFFFSADCWRCSRYEWQWFYYMKNKIEWEKVMWNWKLILAYGRLAVRVDPILKSEYLRTYRASNQKRYGQAFMRKLRINPEREKGERERGKIRWTRWAFYGLNGNTKSIKAALRKRSSIICWFHSNI